MPLGLFGLGTHVPSHTMSLDEATALASAVACDTDRQKRILSTMFRRSRVENRHTCMPHEVAFQWGEDHELGPTTAERMEFYEQYATQIAEQACRNAFDSATFSPADVTHLVNVSCTGFSAPGVDVALINNLDLPRSTQRVQVGFMGCHGAINGLRVAHALSTNPNNRVLMCAVELCSLHFRVHWDPDRFVGNALFADGAAAIVCANSELSRPDAPSSCNIVATGSHLFDDSTDAMTWRIGDHGFEMFLSSQVPELIGKNLKPWLSSWLEQHGYAISDIGSWAVHPGGPRILSAVEEGLDLGPNALDVSREILRDYGNMSSPTVLFILERFLRRQSKLPCLLLGFGPGLVAEAALIA